MNIPNLHKRRKWGDNYRGGKRGREVQAGEEKTAQEALATRTGESRKVGLIRMRRNEGVRSEGLTKNIPRERRGKL